MIEADEVRQISGSPSWYEAIGAIIGRHGGIENITPERNTHVWSVGNKRVTLFEKGISVIRVVAPARPGLPPLETVFHQPLGFSTSSLINSSRVFNGLEEVLAGKAFTPGRTYTRTYMITASTTGLA